MACCETDVSHRRSIKQHCRQTKSFNIRDLKVKVLLYAVLRLKEALTILVGKTKLSCRARMSIDARSVTPKCRKSSFPLKECTSS